MALQEQLKQQGDFLFKHKSYFPLLFIALALVPLHTTINIAIPTRQLYY